MMIVWMTIKRQDYLNCSVLRCITNCALITAVLVCTVLGLGSLVCFLCFHYCSVILGNSRFRKFRWISKFSISEQQLSFTFGDVINFDILKQI